MRNGIIAPFPRCRRTHKPPVRRARGLIGQVCRWLPGRRLIFVADGGYSALELLDRVARTSARRASGAGLAIITRLRLDAALYEPAPVRQAGQKGRPRLKGARLPTLAKRLEDLATVWRKVTLPWYGPVGAQLEVEITSETAVWYHAGQPPVAVTTSGVPADRVLGQSDFKSNGENHWKTIRHDTLCWPYGIHLHRDRLLIADSGNNRVMLWRASSLG